MRKSTLFGVVALLFIVTIGGYFGWTYYNTLNQNNSTPKSVGEQVRDATMDYIKINHSETAQYMQSFSWTGGDITPDGLAGGIWYAYQSSGWNIKIEFPVALPPGSITTYSLTANYAANVTLGNIIVSWQGTMQNSTITESSYTFTP